MELIKALAAQPFTAADATWLLREASSAMDIVLQHQESLRLACEAELREKSHA